METMKFNFTIESLGLILYSNDPKQVSQYSCWKTSSLMSDLHPKPSLHNNPGIIMYADEDSLMSTNKPGWGHAISSSPWKNHSNLKEPVMSAIHKPSQYVKRWL